VEAFQGLARSGQCDAATICTPRQSGQGPAICGTQGSGEQAFDIAQTCVGTLAARPSEASRARYPKPTTWSKRLARSGKNAAFAGSYFQANPWAAVSGVDQAAIRFR